VCSSDLINLDGFVDSVTGGAGTEFLDARQWLLALGIESFFFRVRPSNVKRLIAGNVSFVCSVWGEAGGHSMAAVGYDPAVGVMTLHDPSGERYVRLILGVNDEQGPEYELFGMAFRAEGLRDPETMIDEEDIREIETWVSFTRCLERSGIRKAQGLLEASGLAMDAEMAIRMRARIDALTGNSAEAVRKLERLLSRKPESLELKVELFEAHQCGRNAVALMEYAESLVKQGRLPGKTLSSPWDYIPAPILTRCAEIISKKNADLSEPENIIGQVLKRVPQFASAYAALARIRLSKGEIEESLLPSRIASYLAPEATECAWVRFEALRRKGGTNEAARYLAQLCINSVKIKNSHRLLIMARDLLKSYSKEKEALQVMELIAVKAADEGDCLAVVALDKAEKGDFQAALDMADSLEASGHRAQSLRVRINVAALKGRLAENTQELSAWLEEDPQNLEALSRCASLVESREGMDAAETFLADVNARYPLNEGIRELYCRCIYRKKPLRAIIEFLETLPRENPWDAWAYREIALMKIREAAYLERSEALKAADEAEGWLRALVQFDPASMANGLVEMRIASLRREREVAMEALLRCVRKFPEASALFGEFAAILASMGLSEREGLLEKLVELSGSERASVDSHLTVIALARHYLGTSRAMSMLGDRLGRDSEIDAKLLGFLLDNGDGTRLPDQEMLPIHRGEGSWSDPRFSCIRARLLCQAGREGEAREVLERRLLAVPGDHESRIQLIAILGNAEDKAGGSRLIREFLDMTPLIPEIAIRIGRTAAGIGLHRKAREIALRILKSNPVDREALDLLETTDSIFFLQSEALEKAEAAQAAIPDDPNIALMRIRSLLAIGDPDSARMGDEAYARAIAHWPRYFQLIDYRSSALAEKRDFTGALGVLTADIDAAERMFVEGRISLLEWMKGDKRKAMRELAKTLAIHPEYDWGWSIFWSMLSSIEDNEQPDFIGSLRERIMDTPSRMTALLSLQKGTKLAEGAGMDFKAYAAIHSRNPLALSSAISFLPADDPETDNLRNLLQRDFPSHPGAILDILASRLAEDIETAKEALDAFWMVSPNARAPFEPRLWQLFVTESSKRFILADFFARLANGRLDVLAVQYFLVNLDIFPANTYPVKLGYGKCGKVVAALKACADGKNGEKIAAVLAWWLEDNEGIDAAYDELSGNRWGKKVGSPVWRRYIYEALQKREKGKVVTAFEAYGPEDGSIMCDGWNGLVAWGADANFGIPSNADAADGIAAFSMRVLGGFEPDQYLPLVVYAASAATLRARRYQDFLSLARDYRSILSSSNGNFWLPQNYEWMRYGLPLCLNILESTDGQAADMALRGIKLIRKQSISSEAIALILETAGTKGKVPFITKTLARLAANAKSDGSGTVKGSATYEIVMIVGPILFFMGIGGLLSLIRACSPQ
jgi:tetratricopeptide (TPR) repeat protein